MEIKITGFMHFAYNSTTELMFSCADMSNYGYVKIAPFETVVNFDMPEGFSPIKSAVDSLNKQIEVIDAERERKVRPLKEKIANLLCLEMSPVVDA